MGAAPMDLLKDMINQAGLLGHHRSGTSTAGRDPFYAAKIFSSQLGRVSPDHRLGSTANETVKP
jgi:hypothetical protein